MVLFPCSWVAALAAIAAFPSLAAPGDDPSLRRLIDAAIAASPELAEGRAALAAEEAHVPQAGAPADPTVSTGVQNDGFTRFAVGSAETSFVSLGVTQPLFWPGKRGLREAVARLEASRVQARLGRISLEVEGRARRAYVELQLVRGLAEILADQRQLWSAAEQVARSRYESGQAPQADVLRARLEQARLEQRGWALQAQEAARLAEIARLQASTPGSFPTAPLADQPLEAVPSEEQAWADAQARSPELLLARLGVAQADRRTALARKEERPDLAVSAGVMFRGAMEPMWQVGLSVGLPFWGERKQRQAVIESQQRQIGEARAQESVARSLLSAIRARLATLGALAKASAQSRDVLLVLSEATARSALSQYQVGRLPFAAVLEALSGQAADRAAHLETLAAARRLFIAQQELSFDAPAARANSPQASINPPAAAGGM